MPQELIFTLKSNSLNLLILIHVVAEMTKHLFRLLTEWCKWFLALRSKLYRATGMTAVKGFGVILKKACECLVGHASHGSVGGPLSRKVPMIELNHFFKRFLSAKEEQTSNSHSSEFLFFFCFFLLLDTLSYVLLSFSLFYICWRNYGAFLNYLVLLVLM